MFLTLYPASYLEDQAIECEIILAYYSENPGDTSLHRTPASTVALFVPLSLP